VRLASTLISSNNTPSCRVGILGLGTVGSAVARRLAANDLDGVALTHICDRSAEPKRAAWVERFGASATATIGWTTQPDDLVTSGVDVIVETVGGSAAAEWIRAALNAGKSVVTANKQVIASEGPSLSALAARQGRQLRFEAAVGGAMPIVRAIGDSLAGDEITRIVAILNGTTNAVLSCMDASGCSFESALADARRRGFAEADPAFDTDGLDARAKLVILCAHAFKLRVDPEAITIRSSARVSPAAIAAARRTDGAIRQLAYANYDRATGTLTAWVAPAIVARDSILARTIGPRNAAIVSGRYGGDIEMAGTGAGGEPTAVAVLGDILSIARDRAAIVHSPVLSRPRAMVGLPPADAESPCCWLDDLVADNRDASAPRGLSGCDVHHCVAAEVV